MNETAHPLEGARLKIGRAGEHLSTLKVGLRDYEARAPYELVKEPHPDYQWHVVRAKVREEPPVRLGLIVGDFLNNLRAALDHVAWQLALLKTTSPSWNTQFPVFGKPPIDKRQIRDIPVEAADVMERLQPYHRLYGLNTDPLWILHEGCRFDKHRTITPLGHWFRLFFRIPPTGTGHVLTGTFTDGEVLALAPPDFDLKTDVEPYIETHVAFDVAGIPNGVTLDTLHGILSAVNDEIVPLFERFFFQPDTPDRSREHDSRSEVAPHA